MKNHNNYVPVCPCPIQSLLLMVSQVPPCSSSQSLILSITKPIGSMYAIYGDIYHQYTPFMLAYLPAPWILWERASPPRPPTDSPKELSTARTRRRSSTAVQACDCGAFWTGERAATVWECGKKSQGIGHLFVLTAYFYGIIHSIDYRCYKWAFVSTYNW